MEVDVALVEGVVVVVVVAVMDVVEATWDDVVVGTVKVGLVIVVSEDDTAAGVGRVGVVGRVDGEVGEFRGEDSRFHPIVVAFLQGKNVRRPRNRNKSLNSGERVSRSRVGEESMCVPRDQPSSEVGLVEVVVDGIVIVGIVVGVGMVGIIP